MIAKRIPGANVELAPPLGSKGINPLWVLQKGHVSSSAWEPTPGELQMLNQGGMVVLMMLGDIHPPVKLKVMPREEDD